MKHQTKIAVIGGGAWATALALVSLRGGNRTCLWSRNESVVAEINQKRHNSLYLPNVLLDKGIEAGSDILNVLSGAGIVLLATPAQSIGEVAGALAELVRPGTILMCCAKGIDRETGLLPSQIVAAAVTGCPVAALSGPSFATDVARGLPTAVTIAASAMALAIDLAARLSSSGVRCYGSDDLTGVELGGALKNVMAIAVGAARGLELGASAEAALIARGFAELSRLAVAMGAKSQTLAGLSGLGDLVLTCSSLQSRNFAYGKALAHGNLAAGMALAEGRFTAAIARKLAQKHGVDTPIIDSVSDIVEGKITARQAVMKLMERPLRSETA